MIQVIMLIAGIGMEIGAVFVATHPGFCSLSKTAYQRVQRVTFAVYVTGFAVSVAAAFI